MSKYPVQNKIAGLPDCPAVLAYRLIVDRLRDDPVLKSVGVQWNTWDGDPEAAMPAASGDAPVITLTPGFGAFQFWSTGNQAGPLIVKVDMTVPGLLPDNAMNLWAAMAVALFPPNLGPNDPTYANFVAALQPLGCQTGQVKFSNPAYDPRPDSDGDGMIVATGQFSIDVRLRV